LSRRRRPRVRSTPQHSCDPERTAVRVGGNACGGKLRSGIEKMDLSPFVCAASLLPRRQLVPLPVHAHPVQAFAGGAILMVLANSMIPESYEHGGKLAGLFTVFGFFVSVAMVILENM